MRFLALSALLILVGCASSPKREEPKEMAKLSLDAQEEAQKLRDAGSFQASVAKYQEALRYHASPGIHVELGEVLAQLDRHEESRRQYELALAKNPGMPEAKTNIDRLDAKIELAEQTVQKPERRTPAPESFVADAEPAGSVDGFDEFATDERQEGNVDLTPPTEDTLPDDEFELEEFDLDDYDQGPPEESVAKARDEDFYQEERYFDDMEDIVPPSPGDEGAKRSVLDESAGDIVVSDSEDMFEDEFDTFPTDTVDDQGAGYSPSRVSRRSGGRGLLGPGQGTPSFEVATYTQPETTLDDFEVETAPLNEFEIASDEPASSRPPIIATRAARRQGGRGLTSTPRRISPGVSKSRSPSFANLDGDEPVSFSKAPISERVAKSLSEEKDMEKNFVSDLFDEGEEIDFPEPPKTEPPDRLPETYVVRDGIDLTKHFGSNRFGPRDKVVLNIEACTKRYYEERDVRGAIRCLNGKKIDFADNAEIYFELARIYLKEGDYSSARKELELAVHYAPGNPTYQEALATTDI